MKLANVTQFCYDLTSFCLLEMSNSEWCVKQSYGFVCFVYLCFFIDAD